MGEIISVARLDGGFISHRYRRSYAPIVIVNSRFLQRPQKRNRRNQPIHRRLPQTKSIYSGSDPESQVGRQTGGYGEWCLDLRRGGK